MITIKDKNAIEKMSTAGYLLAEMFELLKIEVKSGLSTLDLDTWIDSYLKSKKLISCSKGYMGYRHSSCISTNDEVVHGVPASNMILKKGDLVKVDVCASYNGYCADMARCYFVEDDFTIEAERLVKVAQLALDKGISKACPGNYLSDISAAIQAEVESNGFGIVREFAGHGIGKKMHEDPEILNYGKPNCGPIIKAGMAFAIEPMITMGDYKIYISRDGWTVKTIDKSLAAHVEDTVIVLENGPKVITRL